MNIFLIYLAINSPLDTGYSYGLGYISSVLKQERHNVDYIVLKNKKDILEMHKRIKQKRPKIIGFSTTTTQFKYLKDITKEIKNNSDAFLVCGGIHTTLKPDCILEINELDAIVRGEGEYPMLELANALEKNIDYSQIKNIWFKGKRGIIKNDIRTLIKDINKLPFPDKNSLNYQKVIDDDNGKNRFIFSRGCTFKCSYCSNKSLLNLYGEGYFRILTPQRAIEEISLNEERYKFNYIIFDDDTINLNKNWFYEFFTLYKNKFKYPFMCNVRPGTVNSDMVKLLKEAGIEMVTMGVEHGNHEFRKTVLKRNLSNKQIIKDFELFDDYGIKMKWAHIMTGLPFENKKLFFDSVKLCRKLRILPNNSIYIFQPYPGTELYDICEKNNWLPDKDSFREREEAVISYPGFNKEEIQLCHDSFNFLINHKYIPLYLPLKWFIALKKLLEKKYIY